MEISPGQTIQKIIFKLMEKVPEKRYQSAEGLLSDLNKYSRGQRDFVLGLDDKQVKLTYRTKLIGRKQELNTLKKLSDKALEGQGSICLVSGRAGQGKTRLVQELREYISQKDCTFISGKCFFGESKVPYGPFKDALNLYIQQSGRKQP